mmetsp:Transcript_63523/g.145526  ORF Transcript_63523/g.145526 Transcript_63523/m.145526 type:complete len:324 (-) Transcript_63523:754-1725(-)
MAAIVALIPPHCPTRCCTAGLLHAKSPSASAPCCDTLSREGCAFMPATIASMPPSAAMLFWCSALPHASFPSVWHASSTIPECPTFAFSAATTWRCPMARTTLILFSACRHRFLSAHEQYWMQRGCWGCSCRAPRICWIPFSSAILTWLAVWHARFPSASVHFCIHPPLRTCVCVASRISSTPPASEMRSWIAELDHARFPRAEQPISWTSTLSRCACIPAMMVSMPPAAATAFCSSLFPHTRFRITCIPSTWTRPSKRHARRAATICSGSPFSLFRSRISRDDCTSEALEPAPVPAFPPAAASFGSAPRRCGCDACTRTSEG